MESDRKRLSRIVPSRLVKCCLLDDLILHLKDPKVTQDLKEKVKPFQVKREESGKFLIKDDCLRKSMK